MSLTVRAEPREITVAPGEEATVVVTVANASDTVEHYAVRLAGLPEGSTARVDPEVTKLHPGRSGDVVVTIAADAGEPPPAGRAVVGVVAGSPYRPDVLRATELAITTPPAPDLVTALPLAARSSR